MPIVTTTAELSPLSSLWPWLSAIIGGILLLIYYQIRSYLHQLRQQPLLQQNKEQLQYIQQQLITFSAQREQLHQILQTQQETLQSQRTAFDEHQRKSAESLQQTAQDGLRTLGQQLSITLEQHNKHTAEKIQQLTQTTQGRLQDIGKRVDEQLAEGFEKTTATFTDVIRRLAIIDEAQKRITELSSNVVSLQEVLTDKRARGAFGEVQLSNLVSQVLPEAHYSLQATLSNDKRVDCLLHLPEPTGHIAIDSKFPLENYRIMLDPQNNAQIKQKASSQFKQDIKKHIKDIAGKYIIPNETSDGAIMFIPAEAVFSEIHAHHHDLVEAAQQARVWIASPTTMMAILTTVHAVLKDAATRKQIHIIQRHLNGLGDDFNRFQKRMDNLARHIGQAQQDVDDVHKSSKKISSHFKKIEAVQLPEEAKSPPLSRQLNPGQLETEGL